MTKESQVYGSKPKKDPQEADRKEKTLAEQNVCRHRAKDKVLKKKSQRHKSESRLEIRK